MYSLIITCKLNDIEPLAWIVDVLAGIADHPIQKLDGLCPGAGQRVWSVVNWRHERHDDRSSQDYARQRRA